jgi:hypothetical protein
MWHLALAIRAQQLGDTQFRCPDEKLTHVPQRARLPRGALRRLSPVFVGKLVKKLRENSISH